MALKSKVSPTIFIVTTVCFLFPFVTVSCNGQKVATFSGVQLATGTTLEQQQMFGPPQKKHVDAEPLATLAAICALAGVGLSFLGIRAAIAPAICGGAGALFLLLLQSKLSTDITQQGQGMFRLEFEAGYALALTSFILATAWNVFVFLQSRKPSTVVSSPPLATAAAISGTSSACPHCGQALSAGTRFCGRCGKPVG